jgi:hypothetical protein
VCQAAACAAAGWETDCDGVVAGRAVTLKMYRAGGAKGIIRSRGIHDGQERARGDKERKSQVQYIWDQRTCTVVYFLTIMTSFSVINPILSEP